ncbi:methyltransferase family protein [Rhodococcus sp. NPDC058521]|uniref:methyltransferase family protein n=1 Tax=Rhodococcus sp. NPDC058521 TaxID=3346536 RepID=UPI00364F1F6A
MTVDIGIEAQRGCAVMFPVLFAAVAFFAGPSTGRLRGAAFMATLWNLIGLTIVNAIAVEVGWWSFGTTGLEWAGVPIDVVLGWSLLWGAVPVLLGQWVNPMWVAAVLVVADLAAMRALTPLVELSGNWYLGEIVAVVGCLVPALALGILTAGRKALRTRAGLQVMLFTALLLFALPTVAFAATGSGWGPHLENLGGPVDPLLAQLAVVVGIVALRAVQEFVNHGGTPFPWDPPTRLTTVGPYAYVANPMQICSVLLLLLGAIAVESWSLAATAVIAAVFGVGIAAFSEKNDLARRFGSEWIEYRVWVRDWVPRWRPADTEHARLFTARGCEPCSRVEMWFRPRSASSLAFDAAEDHPEPLSRIRYERDGLAENGTRAVGLALEHTHLGWAILGWLMRAPGLASFVQLVADATGAGPRPLGRAPRS